MLIKCEGMTSDVKLSILPPPKWKIVENRCRWLRIGFKKALEWERKV